MSSNYLKLDVDKSKVLCSGKKHRLEPYNCLNDLKHGLGVSNEFNRKTLV